MREKFLIFSSAFLNVVLREINKVLKTENPKNYLSVSAKSLAPFYN